MSTAEVSGASQVYKACASPRVKYGQPDWTKIPYKGMPRPSDAEMDKLIDEYARGLADAANSGDDEKYLELRMYAENQLLAQYISPVSPDRKEILKEALDFMKTSAGETLKKGKRPVMSLVDMLNIRDGLIKLDKNGNFDGGVLESGALLKMGFNGYRPDDFKIEYGPEKAEVLGYGRNGWSHGYTNAESRLNREFLTRLNAAEEGYRMLGKAYGTTVSGKTDFTKIDITV